MRQPKPFLRSDRSLWYVQIDGRQYNLGHDKDAAWTEYHKLMGRRGELRRANQKADPDPTTVREIIALFLGSMVRGNDDTLRWYAHFLRQFCKSLPTDLLVAELKPWHVQKWIQSTGWESPSIRGAIRSVQRAMAWAVEMGYLESSPVARMVKPANVARQTLLSESQIELCVNDERNEAIRDMVLVLARTGCRVNEFRRVERRHLSTDCTRWIFPAKESKSGNKTGMPRVVYLSDEIAELCRRNAASLPEGPLFRNSDGNPWTRHSIRCVFRRLRLRHKGTLPENLCATMLRHAWITHALRRGVPVAQVAELAGHRNLQMIQDVYSKLAQLESHLSDAAKRAVG